MPRAEVQRIRTDIGPLDHVDFTGTDIRRAHHELGCDVGPQVQRFVEWKAGKLGEARLLMELRAARAAASALRERLHARTPTGQIRGALGVYLDCLSAWAQGAGLDPVARGLLESTPLDGVPVTGEDVAFLLQAELAGCQTGMLRDTDGSVILWHTEEDHDHPERTRFDRLRLASFQCDTFGPARQFTAFVYPDLLPGPAFGWSGLNYSQAVDAYYLDLKGVTSGVAANAATWVSLFLAGSRTISQIARALAPFRDGYAMSALTHDRQSLRARTTEFVGDTVAYTSLSRKAGSFRTQVNLLTGWAARSANGREAIEPWRRWTQERRMARAQRYVKSLPPHADKLEAIWRLLTSRVGGSWAYANPAVKAHFLCRMSPDGLTLWVGAGPAYGPKPDLQLPHLMAN
jgi:hypothetical protein